jgi:hypothetical protein
MGAYEEPPTPLVFRRWTHEVADGAEAVPFFPVQNGMQRPILRHRDCNSARFRHVIEIGHPEGCPEGMGGRGILGLSPAQRMARLFSSSRGRHSDPD